MLTETPIGRLKPGPDQKRIMIIAGEASGDLHGANLARALKRKIGNLFLFGVGGGCLAEAGMEVIVDSKRLSVVGITEVLPKMNSILKGAARVKEAMRKLRPDLLVLIDFPDFNLHVAATAKRLNIPVLYYISPQIWAWRSGRVRKIAKLVDHMAVILPFEEKFYRSHNVPVTFVGHPLRDKPERRDIASKPKPPGKPAIGLLPGSRDREIETLLPAMVKAAAILKDKYQDIRFPVSVAPSIDADSIKSIIRESGREALFELVCGSVDDFFAKCTIVVAASGTVALEAAMAGVPLVVVYKISPVSYLMGKALVKVKRISLVNLISGSEIAPELIQDRASPEHIAAEVSRMLDNPKVYNRIKRELAGVGRLLGGPGASDRVADIALNMIR